MQPLTKHPTCTLRAGFTLIELSIVLVIIGLVVGGVLVGKSLVSAAGLRATITQVEKFNTAANTFFEKYGALPGDANATVASAFGLAPRGPSRGQGDGNGLIEGYNGTSDIGYVQEAGESVVFWVDLTAARLIDGAFSTASNTVLAGTITGSSLNSYFPQAKMGRGNFFYTYSLGGATGTTGMNFFGLSGINMIGVVSGCFGCLSATTNLTVQEAAIMDAKIDDGYPQTGRVIAYYHNPFPQWAAGAGGFGTNGTAATVGTPTTCYDNSGVSGAVQQYSVEISNGSNVNCALSFRMQAGD